ncbi:MAG: hypothetical protein LBN00_02045 [Oscillospiraceae bacterium]|jgi:hypothetical protein|nr:hypothetical protein [Oscillospiraceae bacterium]
MKRLKRLFSLLIVSALCLSLLPAAAFAASVGDAHDAYVDTVIFPEYGLAEPFVFDPDAQTPQEVVIYDTAYGSAQFGSGQKTYATLTDSAPASFGLQKDGEYNGKYSGARLRTA